MNEEDRFRLLPEDAEGVARDIDFCFELGDYVTARRQLRRLIELLSRCTFGDIGELPEIADALLGAEEILEILSTHGTAGVERECNAGRIAEVLAKVRASKRHLANISEAL